MASKKAATKKSVKKVSAIPLDEMDMLAFLDSWKNNPRTRNPATKKITTNPLGIILQPHTRQAMKKAGVEAVVAVLKKTDLDERFGLWPEHASGDAYGVLCLTHMQWVRVMPSATLTKPFPSLRARAVQHLPLTTGFDGRGGARPERWPGCPSRTCPGCVKALADVAKASEKAAAES